MESSLVAGQANSKRKTSGFAPNDFGARWVMCISVPLAQPALTAFDLPEPGAKTYRIIRQLLTEILNPTAPLRLDEKAEFSLAGAFAPVPLNEVLREVEAKIVRHAVSVRHPQSIAHMVPPPAAVAIVA